MGEAKRKRLLKTPRVPDKAEILAFVVKKFLVLFAAAYKSPDSAGFTSLSEEMLFDFVKTRFDTLILGPHEEIAYEKWKALLGEDKAREYVHDSLVELSNDFILAQHHTPKGVLWYYDEEKED